MADRQNEGFVRQRRNLMIASLVLLFSEATDLKVEKISAFGTELLMGQPQAVTTVLWIAAIYWLIRYYQYYRAEYEQALGNAIQGYIRKYDVIWPVALKRLLHEEPGLLEPFPDVKAVPRIEGTLGTLNIKPNYVEVKLGLTKTADDGRASSTGGIGDRKVRIDGMDLRWLQVRAWIHLILHTTLFTELVLPYLVFVAPVLYAGYRAIS